MIWKAIMDAPKSFEVDGMEFNDRATVLADDNGFIVASCNIWVKHYPLAQ